MTGPFCIREGVRDKLVISYWQNQNSIPLPFCFQQPRFDGDDRENFLKLYCNTFSPRWEIRLHLYAATDPSLVLWPVVYPMRDPSASVPSSLFCQVVFGLLLFLHPVGVHLKVTLAIFSLGILRT